MGRWRPNISLMLPQLRGRMSSLIRQRMLTHQSKLELSRSKAMRSAPALLRPAMGLKQATWARLTAAV